jgi:transcriptional regulator with XRE-family HTH domain
MAGMNSVTSRFDELGLRRKELGISYSILAELSGVSKPAIQRLLTGKVQTPGLTCVSAVAQALGVGGIRFLKDGSIKFDPSVNVQTLRHQQALKKARKLVRPVEKAAVFQGQAGNDADLEAMVERMYNKLLTGSSRQLWSCSSPVPPAKATAPIPDSF